MRLWFLIPLLAGLLLLSSFGLDWRRHQVALDRAQAEAEQAARAQLAAQRARSGSGLVGPFTLKGPRGAEVTIPGPEPLVVNVWLQGCADCMPRFEASQALALSGEAWPQPIVNVAYGRADPAWADRYGVSENLVIDAGAALVNPLGIRTFTTLVIDREGQVVLTDYVGSVGFRERVVAALEEARARPAAAQAEAPPAPAVAEPPPGVDAERDARVWAGCLLLTLGLLGGPLTLSLQGTGRALGEGPIQPWQEELVVKGARCVGCAGRFEEPREAVRCSGCAAAYHRVCAQRSRTCATQGCARRLA